MTLTAVDLYAGAGGMSAGLAQAGFEVVAAVDSWDVAVRSHRRNLPHPVFCEDASEWGRDRLQQVTGLPAGRLDLLAGGPPCQGFSIQRIGADVDARNDLVVAFAHSVAEIEPRMFLMENVPGLLGRRGKTVHATAVAYLESAGYTVATSVINAVDFGVPQSRKRVLVYGTRRDEPAFTLTTDRPVKTVTVQDAIGDLAAPAALDYPSPEDPMHVDGRLSALNLERLRHIPPGGGFEDLPVELRVNCHRPGAAVIGHRGVYGRLHPDMPSGVITARFDSFTRGRFAHPHQDRNLTMREGARLQGFPDDFVFAGNREQIAAQIGNAVPPPVAAAVAGAMRKHLVLTACRNADAR